MGYEWENLQPSERGLQGKLRAEDGKEIRGGREEMKVRLRIVSANNGVMELKGRFSKEEWDNCIAFEDDEKGLTIVPLFHVLYFTKEVIS